MMPPVTGFAWYKEDQYDKFVELCEDGANLPKTYASFLKKAEDEMEQLRRRGITVVKVELDIDEFLAWCLANGHKINGKGRVAFVNHKLISMVEKGAI